ncbi:YhcN/YlaJ family sporulation lipoprotein [Neobacillus sp. DY30]|uniref:YhcN/YlaJ family sporulation lipoprotein n=1 Tax=Neobacillus sp. DY30 TaxID=3047871 RepID=UPI0024BF7172|nr:YhcN/YlaJ family sporulation lipoprotein [Neobacillus sp. DY30]WHY02118.1 YhcN/YlaJ family sporulation lipoprotein [Neobacillus sp. DY30]
MVYIIRVILSVCITLLVSCSQGQTEKDSQLALIKTTNPNPIVTEKNNGQEKVESIEREVESIDEIYDVAVVKGKNDVLVVYKVKHMQRFRMKQIEKDLTKRLEKKYPKEQFTVSSDYKIFLEAVRLVERKNNGSLSDKQAEKRLNEIVKMTSDMK